MAQLSTFLDSLPADIEVAPTDLVRQNTLGIDQQVPAVLMPRTRAAVQKIVMLARQHSMRLHMVSTGKNWGYGSALSGDAEAVVVNLSHLQNIAYDADAGTVSVEPGVTQGQLYDYLLGVKSPFIVPVTGAGPNTSVLGNVLERGYGVTPIEDHFASLVRLEAVLADGTVYRPCMLERSGKCIWKWDVGPYLQGLFSQSALAAVTEVTIRLYEKPDDYGFFVVKSSDLEALVGFVRDVKKIEAVKGVNVMNAERVAAMTTKEATDDKWTTVGLFYCQSEMSRGLTQALKGRAKKWGLRALVVNRRLYAIGRPVARLLSPAMAKVLGGFFDVLEGRPTTVPLDMLGGEHNINHAGLIWYAPVVKTCYADVRALVSMVEEVCKTWQFAAPITCTFSSSYVADLTVPLFFDKASQTETAWRCYDDLLQRGLDLGSVPYRYPVSRTQFFSDTVANKVHTSIKAALDPHSIFTRGRYVL